MSKKKRQKAGAESIPTEASAGNHKIKKNPWRVGIVIGLFIGSVWLGYGFSKKTSEQTKVRQIGGALGCQQAPPFVRAIGFGGKAAFSTSDRKLQGLTLLQGEKVYQHPTWKLAGRLGPMTRDGQGNIFVGPAPWFDTWQNEPEKQNKVYRVDRQTQEMKEFSNLPQAAASTSQNPYGVLGLSFDCETNSIYVSSVAGSTRNEVHGRIFQLDSAGKILSQLENVDALGLAVFISPKDKRLYFGQARTSEIWSVALDEKGHFSGEARKEISLENLGPRGDDKARRLGFAQNKMTVFGIDFNFTLNSPTEKHNTVYHFYYDPAKEAWIYVEEPPQIVSEP